MKFWHIKHTALQGRRTIATFFLVIALLIAAPSPKPAQAIWGENPFSTIMGISIEQVLRFAEEMIKSTVKQTILIGLQTQVYGLIDQAGGRLGGAEQAWDRFVAEAENAARDNVRSEFGSLLSVPIRQTQGIQSSSSSLSARQQAILNSILVPQSGQRLNIAAAYMEESLAGDVDPATNKLAAFGQTQLGVTGFTYLLSDPYASGPSLAAEVASAVSRQTEGNRLVQAGVDQYGGFATKQAYDLNQQLTATLMGSVEGDMHPVVATAMQGLVSRLLAEQIHSLENKFVREVNGQKAKLKAEVDGLRKKVF